MSVKTIDLTKFKKYKYVSRSYICTNPKCWLRGMSRMIVERDDGVKRNLCPHCGKRLKEIFE